MNVTECLVQDKLLPDDIPEAAEQLPLLEEQLHSSSQAGKILYHKIDKTCFISIIILRQFVLFF